MLRMASIDNIVSAIEVRGKFDVIHALERKLPAQMFAAEWVALGRGEDPKIYRPFTKVESTIAEGVWSRPTVATASRYLDAVQMTRSDEG